MSPFSQNTRRLSKWEEWFFRLVEAEGFCKSSVGITAVAARATLSMAEDSANVLNKRLISFTKRMPLLPRGTGTRFLFQWRTSAYAGLMAWLKESVVILLIAVIFIGNHT